MEHKLTVDYGNRMKESWSKLLKLEKRISRQVENLRKSCEHSPKKEKLNKSENVIKLKKECFGQTLPRIPRQTPKVKESPKMREIFNDRVSLPRRRGVLQNVVTIFLPRLSPENALHSVLAYKKALKT